MSGTLAFSYFDSCYLPKQENEFVHNILEELETFLQGNDEKSVLLFPPLPSRLRFLIHKTTESYPSLSTFSVGEGWSRRAVVCYDHLRLTLQDSPDTESGFYEISPGRDQTMEHIRCNHLDSRRSKRPDKAIYIPKAMRAKPLKETQGECVETLSRFSLDSSGDISSLCTSKDSFAETDQRWKNSVNCQESDATSKTDQDVSSNCSNESLREQEAAPPPAKGIDNHWAPSLDQTVSYFMGMSIDDQQDDSESTTAEPAFRPPVPPREEWGDLTKEITAHLKETNVTIEVVRNDYSSYENVWVDPQEFGHVIEIYDFPTVLKTEDLLDAFAAFSEGGLKIKWVDNTHALGVFSSKSAALQALSIQHPLLKARILSEGTKKSKGKALRRAEFIQPVKERPRTDAVVARRMVTRALGLQKRMSRKPQD